MPSQVLTLILNSNHSKRATVLLPYDPAPDPLTWILTEARNKLNTKSLSRIFVRGGYELSTSSDSEDLDLAFNNEGTHREVWASKGEDYMGPPSAKKGRQDGGTAEVRVIARESHIDKKATKQLNAIRDLDGVRVVVGLPDLHPGSKWPIGCSVIADGIYPALIGTDVGCGIALYALSPLPSHPSPQKLASSLSQLDGPWEGDVKSFLAQSPYNITRESAFDKTSLGTVGGGNHFAEICCVERIVDESACESIGKEDGVNLSAKEFEDTLFLLVHTGSRGLGAQILESLTASKGTSNPYLAPSSDELNEYRTDHDYAVEWARANRDLLARRIYECLFPPTNAVPSESDEPAKKFPRKMIDITHNAVTPSTMTVGNEEKEIWIHRKGAAPTDQGIIPCPGSRGAFSWLLKPTGDGIQNGHSLPHGAGRLLARSTAHTSFKGQIEHLTTTSLNSQVVCTERALLIEERPEAYKSLEFVVKDVEDARVGKGVVVLRPLVSYKVREAGERK